ncbi:MAG: hypothetical protein GY869_06865, partial [Planctomycetes bacterium]|nr:hypothetical protein [Planctomycetota bacterium]
SMMAQQAEHHGNCDIEPDEDHLEQPRFKAGIMDFNSQMEFARIINWREFGNGDRLNAPDYSGNTGFDTMVIPSQDPEEQQSPMRSFTLDDGLTNLTGIKVKCESKTVDHYKGGTHEKEYVYSDAGAAPDGYLFLTGFFTGLYLMTKAGIVSVFSNSFVGTHVFSMFHGDLTIDQQTVEGIRLSLDGVTLSEFSAADNPDKHKVSDFYFYQPKRPAIPEGSVILADYMLMADPEPVSQPGLTTIGKGVRRLNASREVFYDDELNNSVNIIMEDENAVGGHRV